MMKVLKPFALFAALANGQDAGDAGAADAGAADPVVDFCDAANHNTVNADGKTIIRVAVIWESNGPFKSDGTPTGSAFMDGFNFFNNELAKKEWVSEAGADTIGAVTYTMEMHAFDSQLESDKIRVEFKDLIGACKDSAGNGVGPYHFMIGATAKKNMDVMYVGEQLGIPNVQASGGNPAMWWAHQAAAMAETPPRRTTYAFGMHLPFIKYTAPIIKAAAKAGSCNKPGGCKTVVILRPYGEFFQQTSSVAAVQWALDEGLEIIGPSKEWCVENAGITTTCQVVGNDCRCMTADEPQKLAQAGVVYDPATIPTVYEIDEAKVFDGGKTIDRNNIYPEFVTAYESVWKDVEKQMKARGEDFVDVIVHWPIKYKSSVKAMKNLNLQPKFFMGWNGGVKPNWVAGNTMELQSAGGAATGDAALDWVDGVHTFGFGQWHQDLTYNDPFFGTNVAGILELWKAEMDMGYTYDEFGAITTGVVLYLAVKEHLFKNEFVGATLKEQRDNLRTSVFNVNGETVWGHVTWNKYQQNTGGGVSTTVSWQLQPNNDWTNQPDASILVLPEAFASVDFVPAFGTWAQRDGCSAVGPDSSWVVQPASPFAICRDCNLFGADIDSPGVFLSNTDSTKCYLDVCPPGNSRPDADTCQECQPGQFNGQPDAPICDQCAIGKYTDTSGASECKNCIGDSTTVRSGSDECVCKKGFYGSPGDGSSCQACPALRTTTNLDARTIEECLCAPGSYPIFDENGALDRCSDKYCYPVDGSEPTFESSLDCPGNDGATNSMTPSVRPGFYAAATTTLGEQADIWQCLDTEFCPGGPTVNSCADHRVGTGCIWCEKGWRQETGTMSCVECDGASTVIFVAAAVVVFVLLPAMLKPFVNSNVLKQSPSTVVGLTALSIVAFNMMSISSLGSYSLKWIEPLKTLIRVADIFQFDLNVIRVQCVVSHSSPVAVYVIQVVGPTVLLALVGILAFSVFKAKGKKVDYAVIVNLMGMLFSFFFVAIAVLSFYPHRCGIKHPFGEKALDRQPDVVCSSGTSRDGSVDYGATYTPLVILSIFAMMLYVVFYLSFIVWAVWKHQSMVIGQNQTFIRSTRFLFFRWKNDCYYWTLFWHGRSLFVALVPIISSGSESGAILQIVLLITLMAAWLAQVSQTNPWRYARLNTLDRFATFLFVLMALSSSYQSEGIGWFVSIVLLAMGLFIIGFCGRELYMAKTSASRPKADFFLCHNTDTTSIVARAAKFTIEYHSGASVLMSVDSMDDVNISLENSRSCKNFIALWTNSSASSMSCAIEITSACFNQRNMAVLEVDPLEPCITEERLGQVEDEWGLDAIETFSSIGLESDKITHALGTLKFVQSVKYNPTGGAKEREDSVLQLLEATGTKNLKVPHLSTLPETANLFIVHDTRSAMSNAAAFVLKNAMRTLSFSIVTSADYSDEKFPTAMLARVEHAIVLLHNGVLSSPTFSASLMALDDSCKIIPVAVGGDVGAPSNDALTTMEKGQVDVDVEQVAALLKKGESVDTKKMAGRYREVFRALSLPFSPAAPTGILNAEVGNVLGRVKAGKRATTIGSVLLK